MIDVELKYRTNTLPKSRTAKMAAWTLTFPVIQERAHLQQYVCFCASESRPDTSIMRRQHMSPAKDCQGLGITKAQTNIVKALSV